MFGSAKSSMYCACPVTFSRPSFRGTDIPTMGSVFTQFHSCTRRPQPTPLLAELPPPGLSRKLLPLKYRVAPHIGLFDRPAQFFAQVRRHGVTGMESILVHRELVFRIK